MTAVTWDDLITHDREWSRGEHRGKSLQRHRFEVEWGFEPVASWDEIALAEGVTRTVVQRAFESAVAKIEKARRHNRRLERKHESRKVVGLKNGIAR